MNRVQIGFMAGKIWQLLSNNSQWSYSELKKVSGLSDIELGAALGWLAKENKVVFDGEDELQFKVYLFSTSDNFFG